MPVTTQPLLVGRYAIYDEIASGGMASVHFGRLLGPVGFTRTVAIKRMHAQFAKDPEFVAMFLDEARLAARIRHPNVVSVIDVVATQGELFLVMEYVQGESLAKLWRAARDAGVEIPIPVIVSIMISVLQGLHAAHEAQSERGKPLGLVHRDVSPQNVLVDVDGVTRVLDFGVAKAAGRVQTTEDGQLKGKVPYMSPEQVRGAPLDRRTDVYAAAVVTWELIAKRMLFQGENPANTVEKVLYGKVEPPSRFSPDAPLELDGIVLRGLQRKPHARPATALEMAQELERAVRPAMISEVAAWVRKTAGDTIQRHAAMVAEIESDSTLHLVPHHPSVPEVPYGNALGGTDPQKTPVDAPITHPDDKTVVDAHPPSLPAETHSQVSSASLSRSFQEPAANRTRTRILAALAGVLVLGGAITLLLVTRSNSTQPAPAANATTTTTTDRNEATASTKAASEPLAAPAATTSESAVPSAAKSVASAPIVPKQPKLPVKPSKADCRYKDDAGIWHIKKECL